MSKKVAILIAERGFRDEELLGIRDLLRAHGFRPRVVAKTRHRAVGAFGTEIEPDLAVPELDAREFAGLVVVGGPGAVQLLVDEEVLKLAQEFMRLKKALGAITIGPSILANAGCLMGRRATALYTEEQNLRNRGVEYTGMPVEVSGAVVTAKDPSVVKEFCEKFIFVLNEI